MKLVMFGTGDFALPTFRALLDAGYQVRALVTQPDRPQGRKQELIPSPIKLAAMERAVPVFQPENVNTSDALAIIREFGADLFVTAAYGQILSADLLGIPPLGGINLHGSILPKYRGAAPVARAIQNGETETGVTVILMTPKIDAGGMIAVARTPIDPQETAGELEALLADLGAPLILETILKLSNGQVEVLPQSRQKVTKAPKLSKSDSQIDWTLSATRIHDLVRAMNPWPLCETSLHWLSFPPTRLIIHKTEVDEGIGMPGHVLEAQKDRLLVACGSGSVRIVTIQVPGKKPMSARDFVNGHHGQLGDAQGLQRAHFE